MLKFPTGQYAEKLPETISNWFAGDCILPAFYIVTAVASICLLLSLAWLIKKEYKTFRLIAISSLTVILAAMVTLAASPSAGWKAAHKDDVEYIAHVMNKHIKLDELRRYDLIAMEVDMRQDKGAIKLLRSELAKKGLKEPGLANQMLDVLMFNYYHQKEVLEKIAKDRKAQASSSQAEYLNASASH